MTSPRAVDKTLVDTCIRAWRWGGAQTASLRATPRPPVKAPAEPYFPISFKGVISPYIPIEQLSISVPEGQDLSGQLVGGRFLVIEPFNQGGFGRIFLCEDTADNNREVLLKIGDDNEFGRESMQAELASFLDIGRDNQNLVECLAAGQNFAILEKVQERSLFSFLNRWGIELTEDYALAALKIIREVLVGLESLEMRGVVSGDISPDNILAVHDPEQVLENGPRVTLIDFGLGKMVEQNTDPDKVFGKPQYMAPEQTRGERDIDGRADVYSAGMVLYAMLTFRHPMGSLTPVEIMLRRGYKNERFIDVFDPQIDLAAIPQERNLRQRVYELVMRLTGKIEGDTWDGGLDYERFDSALAARRVVDRIIEDFTAQRTSI